jgi:putative membrane protein insertion efficiency factor
MSWVQANVGRANPSTPLKLGLLALIRAYQWTIGPALPRSCRFEPSCSRYAYTAIDRHGPLRGSWLTLKRLARCQPWGGSGYDPVP